ncbi:MAG: threonylcarbamoyl-AMP synthase [Spirochaetales bacterium]|nr:threonylcarbamoyl-AMP synthase [Leptospiraceae bacterium]MCP5480630.1 threonylcarbamoyl-AMP synthase [Spirochaetales bacterium]MCP5483982.1 threonylcarbamoyl-AMP synthase [Spirochaetales bacterium]
MIWPIHPQTPEKRRVTQILDELRKGGVLIVPTDTAYAFVCLLDAPRAINDLYRIKAMDERQHLSLLCRDVAMANHYAKNITNVLFRFMKAHTPGPYTFILNANRNVDRRGTGKRKEVGIRIVNHALHIALMEQLDMPLVSTSITTPGDYFTDPADLEQEFGSQVVAVVDGGPRANEYSTVLDCTGDRIRLVRQGLGDVSELEYQIGEED